MSWVIPQPFIQMEYKGYKKYRWGATMASILMHDNMTDYNLSIGQSFSVYEMENYWRWLHYSFEPVLSTWWTLNMNFWSVLESPNWVLAIFTIAPIVWGYTSVPWVLVNGNVQVLWVDYTESAWQITFIWEVPEIEARIEPILIS